MEAKLEYTIAKLFHECGMSAGNRNQRRRNLVIKFCMSVLDMYPELYQSLEDEEQRETFVMQSIIYLLPSQY